MSLQWYFKNGRKQRRKDGGREEGGRESITTIGGYYYTKVLIWNFLEEKIKYLPSIFKQNYSYYQLCERKLLFSEECRLIYVEEMID